jgi:electron transfer flavoprotein alpha subunit
MKILGWSDEDAICMASRKWASGAGEVFSVDRTGLPNQDPNTIAAAIEAAAKENDIDVVLIGSTKLGKDIGARLAALLDASYAADIQSIDVTDKITISRLVLSGNSLATYEISGKLVATVGAGVFEDTEEDIEGTKLVLAGHASPITVTGTSGAAESDFDLTGADYVVGVGRGFKAQADLQLAQTLADKLPGGAVGCSRPVAADLKWLGEEHWIGLSGNEIRPKIYFATGVSGQIQHVAGIRGSKLIVAINTNKDAPIFQVADYSIVGDLYDVLPKLTAALG